MRRPPKDTSQKNPAESQRLITFAQATVQAASRLEERSWERSLDTQVLKLLKNSHQDSIDAALDQLFREDLPAYDTLMRAVEGCSESCMIEQGDAKSTTKYDALLVVAPVLAWTRFEIPSGPIPPDLLLTLNAHFSAHLLADGTKMAMAPTLFSIEQLPRSHAETYATLQKLAQSAFKASPAKAAAKQQAETAPFLADTRYLMAVVLAPTGGPLFRWQAATSQSTHVAERAAALEQWRLQATPNLQRLLPGCGIELLLPEAYYVACREADRQIRPISIRAAVHYLTQTLEVEPSELRAVVAPFCEDLNDGEIDEYRIAFTMRQDADVMYGVVWPLYSEAEDDADPNEPMPHGGIASTAKRRKPMEEILALLHESGVTHVKRHNERFPSDYCDDCGAPLFADPTSELAHAEMPEDAPQGSGHLH